MTDAKANGGTAHAVPLRRIAVQDRRSLDSVDDPKDFERLLNEDETDSSTAEIGQDGRAPSSSLPPTDRGRGAWMCLLGCCMLEALIWGFAISFGVFQRYYISHPLFRESSYIATVGTLATGTSYLGMPVANLVALRWPALRRKMCAVGWCLCVGSLAAASLATGVRELMMFQGLGYGVGWVMCYTPFLFILNEWWVERRGLAYGVLFASSGVSGLFIPVVMDSILERYGFRVALRSYGAMIVLLSGPGLLLIQHRLPPAQRRQLSEKPATSAYEALKPFTSNFHFRLLAAAVFLQGLAFFIPNIYIPEMAKLMGISSTASSWILAALSLSQIAGQLWQGWMSDRVNVYIPASISALYCAISAFFLWGWAKGMVSLLAFAIMWGFFSASYSVLYTRMVGFLLNGDRLDLPTDERVGMLVYGVFSFERGVSNILEGPISGWLQAAHGKRVYWDHFGLGRYQSLITFTIVCMGLSVLVGVGWRRRYTNHPSIYMNR